MSAGRRTAALVPVKQLSAVKERLSEALSEEERAALMLATASHVLSELLSSPSLDAAFVISSDSAVVELAGCLGAEVVPDRGEGLNEAIRRGLEDLEERGFDAALVVFADLPLFKSSDAEEMLALAGGRPSVVVAPDRHGRGTNALLLAPPRAAAPAFGEGSLERHLSAADEVGARVREYRSPGTAFDLDTPDDLRDLGRHLSSALREGSAAACPL